MNLSLMKMKQLVAVAKTGSFSRAAKELHISQPALSRNIADIESHYGIEIFLRHGHGVSPTTAGNQVIDQAERLLRSMQAFDSNLKLLSSGRAGTLTMGMAPLLASQLLANFASDFFSSISKVQVEVTIRPGSMLVEALKQNQIEFFLFPEGYISEDPELQVDPIGHIKPICVVRRDHPLVSRKNLRLEDLKNYPWANSVASPILEKTLKPTQFVCDNYHILRDAVLNSDLICICSSSFIAEELTEGSLREISIKGLPLNQITVYVATQVDRISSTLANSAILKIGQYLQ